MNDYLSKPIDPHELYRKIVKNIKRIKRNENESFLIADQTVEVLSIDQLMESFDPSFRNEFIKILEKEFNDFSERIFPAVQANDSEAVRQLIHKISPSLQRFKNETLSSHLTELKNLMAENSSSVIMTEKLKKIEQECKTIFNVIIHLKEKYSS